MTATLGGDLAVNGALTIKTGTLDVNTANYGISVGGDWSNTGTFTPQSGTVTFNGSGDQQIRGTATTTFKNLKLAPYSSHTTYAYVNLGVTGTMTIDRNCTFTFSSKSLVLNGGEAPQGSTLTGSGTIVVSRTASTAGLDNQYQFSSYTLTGLTVQYSASGTSQTVSAHTYGGLEIANSSGASLGGDVTVAGTLTLTSGALSIGTCVLTLNDAISGNGTLSNLRHRLWGFRGEHDLTGVDASESDD
jgi:hypothetical protein